MAQTAYCPFPQLLAVSLEIAVYTTFQCISLHNQQLPTNVD